MLKASAIVLALLLPTTVSAEERTVTIKGGQVSTEVGLTVQVKSIKLGDDATTLRLLASFDSQATNFVNMNDDENAYLAWGDAPEQRLHMRMIGENKWMRVINGQTMEGDLVFPGSVPDDVERLTLVFNPGQDGDDTNAPGVTLPLDLKP